MSQPLYIYPQWIRAKRELIEVVLRARGDEERMRAVTEWMRTHLFEFGVDFKIYEHDLKIASDPAALMAHVRESNIRKIAHEIARKGLFYEEQTSGPMGAVPEVRNIRCSLVVCGVPTLGVGPAERSD